MTDRSVEVRLLGSSERHLRVAAQLQGVELFDLVASQYTLHEKTYFGLCCHDKDSGGLDYWLQLEKRVAEQLPKSKGPAQLSFGVRYFIPDVSELKEETTRKLFFWQALQLYSTGRLGCETDEALRLAALALQVTEGDFLSESATRHHLDSKKLIPDEVLVAQGSSLEACADNVSRIYKQLQGTSSAEALSQFMTLIQRQPRYGIHYYNVKDAKGVPWIIGISLDGVRLFYYSDPVKPRRVCPWQSIIDCRYSKNKFILETEVLQRQHSSSVSGRSMLAKQGSVDSTGGTTIFTKGGNNEAEGSEVLEFITDNVKYSMVILDMIKTQHEFHKKSMEQRKDKLLPPAPGQVVIREYSDPTQLLQLRSQPSALLNPSVPSKNSPVISRSGSMSNALEGLAGGGGSISSGGGGSLDMATLEGLEQRRKQLLAELGRKKALLSKLERDEKEYLTGAQRRKPTLGQMMRRTEGLEIASKTLTGADASAGGSSSGAGNDTNATSASAATSSIPTPTTIFSDPAESERSVSPSSRRSALQSRRGNSVLETVEKYASRVTPAPGMLPSKPSFITTDEDPAEDQDAEEATSTSEGRPRAFTNSTEGKLSDAGELESPRASLSPSLSFTSGLGGGNAFFPTNNPSRGMPKVDEV